MFSYHNMQKGDMSILDILISQSHLSGRDWANVPMAHLVLAQSVRKNGSL